MGRRGEGHTFSRPQAGQIVRSGQGRSCLAYSSLSLSLHFCLCRSPSLCCYMNFDSGPGQGSLLQKSAQSGRPLHSRPPPAPARLPPHLMSQSPSDSSSATEGFIPNSAFSTVGRPHHAHHSHNRHQHQGQQPAQGTPHHDPSHAQQQHKNSLGRFAKSGGHHR